MENTTRRTFMQTAGAAISAPIILGASNKSGSQKLILGEGDHKYEVTHDWGELPANIMPPTVIHAFLMSGAKHPETAKAFLDFLRSSDARRIIEAKGMRPSPQ